MYVIKEALTGLHRLKDFVRINFCVYFYKGNFIILIFLLLGKTEYFFGQIEIYFTYNSSIF